MEEPVAPITSSGRTWTKAPVHPDSAKVSFEYNPEDQEFSLNVSFREIKVFFGSGRSLKLFGSSGKFVGRNVEK